MMNLPLCALFPPLSLHGLITRLVASLVPLFIYFFSRRIISLRLPLRLNFIRLGTFSASPCGNKNALIIFHRANIPPTEE